MVGGTCNRYLRAVCSGPDGRTQFSAAPAPVLTCPDSEFASRELRTTRQDDQPLVGLVFFARSRVFARLCADSCGLRVFPQAPGFGRFHSLRGILLSASISAEGPKSTSARNWPIKNQRLIGGPIKRLIRGIGRRRKQQRQPSERKPLDLWLG